MRAIVLASAALALCLPACDKAPSTEGVFGLFSEAKVCRDTRGRFAKCQTCKDGSRIWVGAECPVPPPPFDPASLLQPAWGTGKMPAENLNDVVGAFRFICGPSKLAYDDPIVFPGQPGKSHLHDFYGAKDIDASSTHESLLAHGESSCNDVPGSGHAANNSGYWLPALLDGRGNVARPDYTQVYYKREPQGPGTFCDPANKNGVGAWGGRCEGIPDGLKFIRGFDMVQGRKGEVEGQYVCTGSAGSSTVYHDFPSLKTSGKCVAGGQMEMRIASGRCWNGQLDSPDHQSHLIAMYLDRNTGRKLCPTTHPIYLAQVTFATFFTLIEGDDVAEFSLSSDVMHPELPAGSTLHFDYLEAWVPSIKQMWVDNCVGKKLNCSGGDLGNGLQLRGAAQPMYGGKLAWRNPVPRVPIPPRP